jgi:hypothetical protein
MMTYEQRLEQAHSLTINNILSRLYRSSRFTRDYRDPYGIRDFKAEGRRERNAEILTDLRRCGNDYPIHCAFRKWIDGYK